ncbi:protein HESO1-like [Chenopodium quinoa]|uniref:Poly(A) RNA polymerase mitochondrial-like central palm domain-containing protein n=1 Tax=Chenopodium quinoa TaxID=63459 RepID=A0A803N525_CHEQI|nr:protein HESO1-like [Chenopodium quinoa]
MGSQSMLELTLNEILHVINPLREDLETRMQIIEELRVAVSTIESLRGATVEPFGSFVSQLFSRWGDLDISIELSNGLYIAVAARKHKQALLGDVLKALRRAGSFRRLQSVSHARVPILKLESKYQNISCDISINNVSGKMKSKFLLWISLIDQRFRNMVLLVKEWAKANNINSPKTGTFNSYSLSLLVIFHFQTCLPAILPPLKDLYPGNMADELIGIKADVERRIEEISLSNISKFNKERRVNHSSLSELFTSFLAKFSDISTRATELGISTYTGHWEDINTTTRWLPKTFAIFIEDPFEQPENTARAVTNTQLTRIGEVFTNTYHRIIAPNQTRNTLIPSLVRYEISHFFPGAAFASPMANGRAYPRTNHNARYSSSSNSSLQFQHPFQRTRQLSHPNNMTPQKSNQVFQGQASANIQRFPRNSPRSQPKRVAREAATPSEGLAQPHTPRPGQVNNVATQKPAKVSQRQTQQIWRPKQSDS